MIGKDSLMNERTRKIMYDNVQPAQERCSSLVSLPDRQNRRVAPDNDFQ